MGQGNKNTFGRSLMKFVQSRLPYQSYQTIDTLSDVNPKYKIFQGEGSRREDALQRQSISSSTQINNSAVGDIAMDKGFQDFMYANIQQDKAARIRDYRVMAAFAEVGDALDEICDEIINKDDNGEVIKLNLIHREFKPTEQKDLQDEFQKFVGYFDFEHKGWEYFRQLLVEGEIYWEHIIHKDYPKEGILGTVQIPTELIDPIFGNIQNSIIQGYLLRKPIFNEQNPTKVEDMQLIPMDKNQVTYINSGIWNDNKTIRLPYLENARRAYRQLSLIEDAIVIYRLVRAPEKLVFNVDVGNMSPPKAEGYLRNLQQKYWSRHTFDQDQNGTVMKFSPQSMLDSFWFAKRAGSEGTSVQTLAGGCLAMDTKIPLLDGRVLTLTELTEEFNNNKENWVYSCCPNTGKVVPGKIAWSGVTQESAEVMKLTLDNGREIICTPDHKFPIIGKGFVEAKDLIVNESMIPFNTQHKSINGSEYLPDPIQVGTLTIDNEYHTFALEQGVFTKNSNLGELEDLMYFMKKLYKSLKVPVTRLNPEQSFQDGVDILREELKFARFIIRLQMQFAAGLKNGFITHLKLKKLWEKYNLKETQLDLVFNVPSNFFEMREQQKLELKVNNWSSLTSSEFVSNTWAQKKYLGWSDIEVKANREFLRKDKELQWELTQIESTGPNWRDAMVSGETSGEGLEPGMGGGVPPGGGGLPPDFGPPPAGGGEEVTGEEPAPEPAPEEVPPVA